MVNMWLNHAVTVRCENMYEHWSTGETPVGFAVSMTLHLLRSKRKPSPKTIPPRRLASGWFLEALSSWVEWFSGRWRAMTNTRHAHTRNSTQSKAGCKWVWMRVLVCMYPSISYSTKSGDKLSQLKLWTNRWKRMKERTAFVLHYSAEQIVVQKDRRSKLQVVVAMHISIFLF